MTETNEQANSGSPANPQSSAGIDNSEEEQLKLNQACSGAPAYSFSNGTDTGFYMGASSSKWSVAWAGSDISFSVPKSVDDIYELYAQGKTMKEHTQEYIDVIRKLKWVQDDELKMAETFEQFRVLLFPEEGEPGYGRPVVLPPR